MVLDVCNYTIYCIPCAAGSTAIVDEQCPGFSLISMLTNSFDPACPPLILSFLASFALRFDSQRHDAVAIVLVISQLARPG